MKVMLIGGTGTISSAVVESLLARGDEVVLLNRGNKPAPDGVRLLKADIHREDEVKALLEGEQFDCVCEFTGFVAEDALRDIRLFSGKTEQFIYISSASAYEKPVRAYPITEETPLVNPYWQYSRNKALSEEIYFKAYKEEGFPVTVVRPSHTFNEKRLPTAFHGKNGPWQVVKRILDGKPVILPGDGTSLWTTTFSSDFAVGFTGLIGNKDAIGEAFHITTDEVMSWNQIYETIAKAMSREVRIVHIPSEILAADDPGWDLGGQLLGDKANSVIFDNTKIKSFVPGFHCVISMSKGLSRAARYMAEHPEDQVEDPEFDRWCDQEIARYGR